MSSYTEHLTRLRRQEQESRGYATSSRWYTGLSNAISFLERAENNGDPLDCFRDAWAGAYNLFMLHGRSGDDEHRCFNRWVSEVKDIPEVRRAFSTESVPFAAFRETVNKTKNTLLKPQGLQGLQAWSARSASPDKACRYFFDIVRDMRNTCAHPDFNPKSAAVKKALTTAADCLVPMVASAIQAMIEQPVEGTTGRTTAYRSFLWPFLKNADSFFSDYYLERLFSEEELDAFPEEQARDLLKSIAKQYDSLRTTLVTADAEETRQQWGVPVLFQALAADLHEGVRLITDDGVFEPSFVLKQAELSGKPRQEYQGKDAGRDLACLIWMLPWRSSLDVIVTDGTSEPLPIMELAHRALTHADVPWAMLTNGQQLRLLGKGTAHKPRCFLEIDLAAIVDRRGDSEALFAFRYCQGLFSGASFMEKDGNDHTRLDRVLIGSERHGKEIGDELKQNVFRALEELGDGFLRYLRTHPTELEEWRTQKGTTPSANVFLASEPLLEDIYHESLSLMYRLLFLFYAESRNMLPMEDEMYRESYSLESIRDDIISVHDDPDSRRFFGQGDTQLWDRLTELFRFLNTGWRGVIPAYNGGLFDSEHHKFLEQCKVPDYFLARAIDLLSRTQPRFGQNRGEGRKKVTYRDLDIRHLGSIYEGILEYSAHIADQDMVVMKRGSGGNTYEEYVPVAKLEGSEKQQLAAWRQAAEENPDNPQLPRGCKVTGEREKGSYFLVHGGRESKRKSSGSYYTPDYIVQYIVENTLAPLIRGECRAKPEPLSDELKRIGAKEKPAPTGPLSPNEILDLKVLDPAMGSGHFLVAATEFLARAYGKALLRESQIVGGAISDDEFIRHKRMIVERCIYGVDINPMAVELAKLSLWLFTMDRSRPLSFLDHHLKWGHSLIGARISDLGELPKFSRNGIVVKKQIKNVQENLFEHHFKAKVPLMIRDLFGIMKRETLTPDDIEVKKLLDTAVEETKRPFKNVDDAWTGKFFEEGINDYLSILSNVELARKLNSQSASQYRFFHWEIEFPEVWFDEDGKRIVNGGFSAVLGNPPYVRMEDIKPLKPFLKPWYECHDERADLYAYFFEQAILLLQSRGYLGYISSNKWIRTGYGEPLRLYFSKNVRLISLIDFGHAPIFIGADTFPAIVIVAREKVKDTETVSVLQVPRSHPSEYGANTLRSDRSYTIPASRLNSSTWSLGHPEEYKLLRKIEDGKISLQDYLGVSALRGVVTGLNAAFLVTNNVKSEICKRSPEASKFFVPFLRGRDIKRWLPINHSLWLIYTYHGCDVSGCSALLEYLSQFIESLENRSTKQEWYELQQPQERFRQYFEQEKILVADITWRIEFAIDSSHYFDATTYALPTKDYFILGLLNSPLLWWYYWRRAQRAKDDGLRIKHDLLNRLPIPKIQESLKSDICRVTESLILMRKNNKDIAGRVSLEEKLSILCMEAYGLTRGEQNLLWETMPPRDPISTLKSSLIPSRKLI